MNDYDLKDSMFINWIVKPFCIVGLSILIVAPIIIFLIAGKK